MMSTELLNVQAIDVLEDPSPPFSTGSSDTAPDPRELPPLAKSASVLGVLGLILQEAIRQTWHILTQNLSCVSSLVRALPTPFFDLIRLLTSLWLEVFHAFFLICLALLLRTIVEAFGKIGGFIARQRQRWNGVDVRRFFQRRAPSSVGDAHTPVPASQPVYHRSTTVSPHHPTIKTALRKTLPKPIRASRAT